MAGVRGRRLRGVDDRFDNAPRDFLRDARPMSMRMSDWLRQGPNASVILAMMAVLTLFFPGLMEITLISGVLFFWWVRSQRSRLPMMLPASSEMIDWGDLAPGSNKPRKAGGIMFFGNDRDGEEIWVTNDYARRHILILGTTGAGKTEGLVSLATNALGWSSGFLYTDGKGDTKLYSQIYSLARRFGRDDDLLLLNFMNTGRDGAGESNTLNPFGDGAASALTELLVSLMDDSGSEGGMWKGRAISLLTGVVRALVELRERGDVLLDVELIRDNMTLDRIVELNGRGERGEITPNAAKAVKAYLESLPGFNWEKAKTGKPQAQTTLDQHGYLQMQFTRMLSSLVDVYGYIFKAPLGDIDLYDVVVNRRILVVLLPALAKSEDEVGQLGKIIVACLKQMMGRALGDKVEGDTDEIIGSKPTNAPSPFLSILDEVGYYTIPGMAVMPAQARSLGFSMIFAGQDVNAMKKKGGAVEKEVDAIVANCNIKIAGKIEDPGATYDLFLKAAGEVAVTQASGFSMNPNSLALNYMDRRDASIERRARIDLLDLKAQVEGEMHMICSDRLIRGSFFYANPKIAKRIEINDLLRVRPPRRTPDDGKETGEVLARMREDGWTAAGAMPVSAANAEISAAAQVMRHARKLPALERSAAAIAAITALLEGGVMPPTARNDEAPEGREERTPPHVEQNAGPIVAAPSAAQGGGFGGRNALEEAFAGLMGMDEGASNKAPDRGRGNQGGPSWESLFSQDGQGGGQGAPVGGKPEGDGGDWLSGFGADESEHAQESGPLAGLVADLDASGSDPFAELLEEALRAARGPNQPPQGPGSAIEIGALWADDEEGLAANVAGDGVGEDYDKRLAHDLKDIERAAGVPDPTAARIGESVAAALDKAVDYPPLPTPRPVEDDALKALLGDVLDGLSRGDDSKDGKGK